MALTSQLFGEGERCVISDLPSPWCGCWKCRPDVTTDIPGSTPDIYEEELA